VKTGIRTQAGVVIVDVSGDIDMGTSPSLRKTLLDSLKKTQRLVVNLQEVGYVGSSGIASLVEVLKETRRTKKKLFLVGLNKPVYEVLQLTHLTRIFDIRETEDAALEA
jgi:anti-sigma B factor antagonist